MSSGLSQEKQSRTVFVGNIPFEATDEQIRDILVQAGPIISFRIMNDRETGKPKGFGFCEYQDTETAASAVRNLNNFDFHGRALRIGPAGGEQVGGSRAGATQESGYGSMQTAIGGPTPESPYGEPVEPSRAPEKITQAVASLPPEQMYRMMKQMKEVIQKDPTQARKMLLENPQLAYALLQAQIVMKIVDPQVAMAMLHRETQAPPVLRHSVEPMGVHQPVASPYPQLAAGSAPANVPPPPPPPSSSSSSYSMGQMAQQQQPPPPPWAGAPATRPSLLGERPPMGMPNAAHGPPGAVNMPMGMPVPSAARLPSSAIPTAAGMPGPPVAGPSSATSQEQTLSKKVNAALSGDNEKAKLLMQVLNLKEEQIQQLPPEQQQSIRVLRSQVLKGGT